MSRKKREAIIITLDTETIGLEGALKRIAIYDGKEITYGYDFSDVLPKILSWYDKGFFPHIYIHNFDFDGRKMPEIFYTENVLWNTTKKINNRYVRLTCKKYTIHDSIKILPFALAKLSKDFELEHGKMDLWEAVQKTYPDEYIDHVDFLNRCNKDDPLYLEYLGYDVISLYELIQKLISISKLKIEDFVKILSTASLSRFLFRNGYGGEVFKTEGQEKTDFEILESMKAWSSKKTMQHSKISYIECENKIRQGFFGGRTEVFTPICNGSAFHYDVNSLYPSVMIDNEFPVGFPEYHDEARVCKILWREWLEDKKGLGFIRASVFIPEQKIPPLPVKMQKLVFVTGYITGTWTYNELEYAIKNCNVEILEIHEMIHFKKSFKVFKNFVTTFYQLKEKATRDQNESLRSFSKLILNTAYGWTCLRRDDKTCLKDWRMLEDWEEKAPERIIYKNEEMGFFEMWDNVTATTIQVQIGAYVTSYARIVLLDALRKQAEKGIVYYCDTDSIVCSESMPPEIVDGERLGAWDLENEITGGIFLQPKVYTELLKEAKKGKKQTIKFKGITKKRQGELNYQYYQSILEKLQNGSREKMIVEENRKSLPSLAVAQKNHKDPNIMNCINKSIDLGAKQKRNIDYNANTSKPWHMTSKEMFETFNFASFDNPPDPVNNLFGGLTE